MILGSRSSPWDPAKRIPKNAGNDYWVSFKLNYSRDLNTRHISCCVFRPAFGCCTHPKAGPTTFFSRFQPCLFILNLVQWFHARNQQKTSENEQKRDICLLFKAAKSSSSKKSTKKDKFEVPPQGVDQLLHVDQLWGVDKHHFFCSVSDVFCWFQSWSHWKRFKINKKGLNLGLSTTSLNNCQLFFQHPGKLWIPARTESPNGNFNFWFIFFSFLALFDCDFFWY